MNQYATNVSRLSKQGCPVRAFRRGYDGKFVIIIGPRNTNKLATTDEALVERMFAQGKEVRMQCERYPSCPTCEVNLRTGKRRRREGAYSKTDQ